MRPVSVGPVEQSWDALAEYTAETVAELYYDIASPEALADLVARAIVHYNHEHAGIDPNRYA